MYFKYFNDTYGYKRGDKLLMRMASLPIHSGRGVICSSRVVSDNIVWAVRFDKGSPEDIYRIIADTTATRENVLREEFDCTRIRLAVGVYLIDKERKNVNPEAAVSNVNLARKKAKESGSSSVAFYQPKISSEDGRIMGAEALIRWKKDGRFMFPDQFIPAIERSCQIIQVDYYMCNEVFAFIRSRLGAGLKVLPALECSAGKRKDCYRKHYQNDKRTWNDVLM